MPSLIHIEFLRFFITVYIFLKSDECLLIVTIVHHLRLSYLYVIPFSSRVLSQRYVLASAFHV